MSLSVNRRRFVTSAGAMVLSFPIVSSLGRHSRRPRWGPEHCQYEFIHDWARLPDEYSWQTTHDVAVDSNGLVYVIHEGRAELKDHPAIFVFDSDGNFVRAFGNQFQGGGHGLEIRSEAGQEFIYVAAYQQIKSIAKLTLTGQVVWEKFAPMESGIYAPNEDSQRTATWGRDRFMPTNFAFLPDGDFLVADGYGSYYIHRYDADGNWKSCFGGPGDGDGRFNLPHGLWLDTSGSEPVLIVTDRVPHKLQYLTIDGVHLKTLEGFGLPANVDIRHGQILVPELLGRVTILNADGSVAARLGDDSDRIRADEKFEIRRDINQWHAGKFVHPHDACFDAWGNIYVAEWVAGGRLSKLRKMD